MLNKFFSYFCFKNLNNFHPIKFLQLIGMFEPMISKGMITNFSQQNLWKCIEFYKTYFTHCYYNLRELTAVIEGGLRDEDAGVLYDILYLRTKYKIADVQCAMLTKFAFFCCGKLGCIDVQLNAVNAEGPEMSMRQIIKIIDETSVRLEKTKLSCWKDFTNRVPGSCRGKVGTKEECPSLAKEGAEKVAEIFEVSFFSRIFLFIYLHIVYLGSH
jgi:hypothetical protein